MTSATNNLTSLAAAYDECESDEEEESQPPNSSAKNENKRTICAERENGKNNEPQKRAKLEIPAGILDMFKASEQPLPSSLSDHQGRTRGFEHVAGNWATHILIPIDLPGHFTEFLNSMEALWPEGAPQLHTMDLEDIHISISRTVPIRHHWIKPLKQLLQKEIQGRRKFIFSFSKMNVYVNDEKSRSFVALDVDEGIVELEKLVGVVDKVFNEFGLPEYYKKPSFHASFSWALGDVTEILGNTTLAKIQSSFDNYIDDYSTLVFKAKEVQYRTGNKTFHLRLEDGITQ